MSNDIFADFESRGVNRHSMPLLPPFAALDFVRECRVRGLELLGFDGFKLLPNDRIQPYMEHSLDLSDSHHSDLSSVEKASFAENFLEERLQTDFLFEMVVR